MMHEYWGWDTSITIQNAGLASTDVTVTYYNQGGGVEDTDTTINNLAPNISATLNQGTNPNLPTSYLGHAVITSSLGQPLAVVVQEYATDAWTAYNGFSDGASTAYIPLVMDNYYGWKTGFSVQNLESYAANSVEITYYWPNGSPALIRSNLNIAGNGSAFFYTPNEGLPSGFDSGTAEVKCDNCSNKLTAVVNATYPYTMTQKAMSHDAFLGGTANLYAPVVMSNYGPEDWVSSVTVQNLDSSTRTATITYYDTDGSHKAAKTVGIDGKGQHVFYVPADLGYIDWRGSAKVRAWPNSVAVVNASGSGTTVEPAWRPSP